MLLVARHSFRYMGIIGSGRKIWVPASAWRKAGGRLLRSCASARIGEIDEATILFGTEKSVTQAIQGADVLIFGTAVWNELFREAKARNGLLRTACVSICWHSAGVPKAEKRSDLLDKFHLHPSALIFDVDPYFTGGMSRHAQAIAADPSGELRAIEDTQRYIDRYSRYCRYLGWLCGRTSAGYRALDGLGIYFPTSLERFWFGKATNRPLSFAQSTNVGYRELRRVSSKCSRSHCGRRNGFKLRHFHGGAQQ